MQRNYIVIPLLSGSLRKSWSTYPVVGRVFLLPRPFRPGQFRPSSHGQLTRSYIKRQMADKSRSNITWLTCPSDVTTSSVGHLFCYITRLVNLLSDSPSYFYVLLLSVHVLINQLDKDPFGFLPMPCPQKIWGPSKFSCLELVEFALLLPNKGFYRNWREF